MTKERLRSRLQRGRLTEKQHKVLHSLATGGPGHVPSIAPRVGEGRTTVQKILRRFELWGFVELQQRVQGHRGGEPAKIYVPSSRGLWWWLSRGDEGWDDVCRASDFYSRTLPHVLGKTRVYEENRAHRIFLSLVQAFNPLEPPPWITVGGIDVQPVWPQEETYDETTCTFYYWAESRHKTILGPMEQLAWQRIFNDPDLARLKEQIHRRIAEAFRNLAPSPRSKESEA